MPLPWVCQKKYEFFHDWKRLEEREPGSVALETMLRGICKKENYFQLPDGEEVVVGRVLEVDETIQENYVSIFKAGNFEDFLKQGE